MIDKPSLLDTPNLINWKEYTPSDIPGSSVDYCYGNDSSIRQNYDGTDTAEWNTGKQIQETLPAAEWDAFIHDLGAFGWQMTEITRSIWEELYSAIHGQQPDMEHELLDVIEAGAQTLTNKIISFDNNTLQNIASLDTAQTLTNKTISFDNNTLQNVASLNTEQTLLNKTLDLSSNTNKIFVSTANRVLVSDANKKIVPAADTTDTEIGYVHGVTSNIQTQLNTINNRPPIGIPFFWMADKPDWAIDFGNGASTKYLWSVYPELNNDMFKAILTKHYEAGSCQNYDNEGFYVPDLRGLVPIGYGTNAVRTGETTSGGPNICNYWASLNKYHRHDKGNYRIQGQISYFRYATIAGTDSSTGTGALNYYTTSSNNIKECALGSSSYSPRNLKIDTNLNSGGGWTGYSGYDGSSTATAGKPATFAGMWIVRFE